MSRQIAHFVDTCVFVACGVSNDPKFRTLGKTAKRLGTTFLVPPRVYEELGGDPKTEAYASGSVPIESAIQSGWVAVTDPPDYSVAVVSKVMDHATRFIADETDRPRDEVEKTDTALLGLAVQFLAEGNADEVKIYTGDKPAGKAAEAIVPEYGFDDNQIEWIDGTEFVDDLREELPD